MTKAVNKSEALLASVSGKSLTREERVEKAIKLASYLLEDTLQETTLKEKKRAKILAKILTNRKGKTFLTSLTDQAFRTKSSSRAANQIAYLIEKFKPLTFLNEFDQIKCLLFSHLGPHFPHLFVPFLKKDIRKEMAPVLLPQNPQKMGDYLEKLKKENVRVNINHLGEAILSENEATRRLNVYLEDLTNPQIEYISIKISTIFSQINQIGWDKSKEILMERLSRLYRAAKDNYFVREDGTKVQKFVNLDMEEYRDLPLTVDVFKTVLERSEFASLKAGIVLQSYIPDSFAIQQSLTNWAMARVKNGGSPIKIRIVKGANLAMETVESSLKNWPKPTFDNKWEADANFKRMLEYGFEKEHAGAVHIGVGSHNLFDLSYALVLRSENRLEDKVEFEMLQGMHDPMRRAVQKVSKDMLLYCPEAKEKDFQNAVAYLIRRLDENSGPENFLKDMFEILPANAKWDSQKKRFKDSVASINTLSDAPKRTQDRSKTLASSPTDFFKNEADTDFSLEKNRNWALSILKEWKEKKFEPIPLVIGGKVLEGEKRNGYDPSFPKTPLFSYSLADKEQINLAMSTAKNAEFSWQKLPVQERFDLLGKVAQHFREKRKELIGSMVANGGKTIWEADPEVSEAIDFIEYYRKNWKEHLELKDLSFTPKGTILVTPPWNFPCSIPTGAIAGALTTGNTVIFKPAPEAVLVGWTLVQLFWEAGVPKEVLQFVNCDEESSGTALVQHPQLNGVLLTGATATALKFMKLKPGIDLNAETGGKNTLIVTSLADRDLAIRDIIQSAFGHSGQKCSACSLAILEKEVYEDAHFLQQLKNGVESLTVGSQWDPSTKVGPLIHAPEGALLKALTQLEPGETWLVEPKQVSDNPGLWSCGIKLGVKRGSFTHQTELFGPVLGIMKADSLEEAIEIANETPYGLTAGLHSLDEREHLLWKNKIIAGNLYINRSITGAIVQRQPFGGCKASSFGAEVKAGGPNYLFSLAKATQISLPNDKAPLPAALLPLISTLSNWGLTSEEQSVWKKSCESYAYWAPLLKRPLDLSKVIGQDNFFCLVPRGKVRLRIIENKMLPLLQIISACLICETPLEISTSFPQLIHLKGVTWIEEDEESFIRRLKKGQTRTIGLPSNEMAEKGAEAGTTFQSAQVLSNGRIELLHYLREISLSVDYHRYGYLGIREIDIL